MKKALAMALALAMTIISDPYTGYAAEADLYADFMDKPAYTTADAELLARLLWSECRGEPYEGQLMVAQCVLDRLADGRWGDTLESVITAPRQFAPVGELDEKLLEVAEAALAGERLDTNHRILFFRVSNNREWYAPWLGKVGKHSYYGEVIAHETD